MRAMTVFAADRALLDAFRRGARAALATVYFTTSTTSRRWPATGSRSRPPARGWSCGTKTDGAMWCWGFRAAAVPDLVTVPVPVK
jgi:hypothetical protein